MASNMVHSSMEKWKHALTCQLCMELYNDKDRQPKSLPCLHCFCQPCLADMIQHRESNALSCPVCRNQFSARNVDALKTNHVLMDLADTVDDAEDDGFPVQYCQTHPGKKIVKACVYHGKLFCFACLAGNNYCSWTIDQQTALDMLDKMMDDILIKMEKNKWRLEMVYSRIKEVEEWEKEVNELMEKKNKYYLRYGFEVNDWKKCIEKEVEMGKPKNFKELQEIFNNYQERCSQLQSVKNMCKQKKIQAVVEAKLIDIHTMGGYYDYWIDYWYCPDTKDVFARVMSTGSKTSKRDKLRASTRRMETTNGDEFYQHVLLHIKALLMFVVILFICCVFAFIFCSKEQSLVNALMWAPVFALGATTALKVLSSNNLLSPPIVLDQLEMDVISFNTQPTDIYTINQCGNGIGYFGKCLMIFNSFKNVHDLKYLGKFDEEIRDVRLLDDGNIVICTKPPRSTLAVIKGLIVRDRTNYNITLYDSSLNMVQPLLEWTRNKRFLSAISDNSICVYEYGSSYAKVYGMEGSLVGNIYLQSLECFYRHIYINWDEVSHQASAIVHPYSDNNVITVFTHHRRVGRLITLLVRGWVGLFLFMGVGILGGWHGILDEWLLLWGHIFCKGQLQIKKFTIENRALFFRPASKNCVASSINHVFILEARSHRVHVYDVDTGHKVKTINITGLDWWEILDGIWYVEDQLIASVRKMSWFRRRSFITKLLKIKVA